MPNIVLPAPGGDTNIWGQKLNDAVSIVNDGVDTVSAIVNTGRLSTATLNNTFQTVINGGLFVTPDGVTDSTSGFNSAVASALSTGKELVLPPGVIVTSALSVTVSNNLKIRGSGLGRTVLKLVSSAAPGHLLRITGGTANRCEISDLTLDGNNVTLAADSLSSVLKLDSRNAGQTVIHHVEVKNSSATGVVAYNSAIQLRDSWIHDCVLEGVTPHANYATEISGNLIETCSRNGIRVGSSASTTKYNGVLTIIANNRIRNITDAFAGTGQYGNGILVYRVADVVVADNNISNTDWAFIRANRADNIVISGNIGTTNVNQQGIFVEFDTDYAVVVGNKVSGVDGISVANTNNGTFESTVTGNTVKISSVSGAAYGIFCESGIVANNVIDGGGNCRYGVSQIGGGTTVKSQLTVSGNHISGTKYAIGIPATNSHMESFTEVTGNKVTRRDSNWASFFGAIGGSTSDAGNGNSIGSYASRVFIDQPTESVASGEEPTGVKIGSRLQIANVLKTWNGTAWA